MNAQALEVLIIDDQVDLSELLRVMLARRGITRVHIAHGGDEGVALMRAHGREIRMIFCDLMMPGKDGIETLREIAGTDTRAAVAIMSALEPPLLRSAANLAVEHGLRLLGCFPKPLSAADVDRALSLVLTDEKSNAPRSIDVGAVAQALRAGSIVPHYQPIVDVASGQAWGVEALARWSDARHGLLPADQFVQLIEDHGLARRLTESIIHTALRDLASWEQRDPGLILTVNVPPVAIDRVELPEELEQQIRAAGFKPERLVLEITERGVASNPIVLLEVATRCRLKGFGLAIDDFGKGEATLAQLKRLPFSFIKLDSHILASSQQDEMGMTILNSTIELGRRLGLKVIAEGIEDAATWRIAKDLRCDLAQGHYIGEAMPPEQVLEWVKGWRARR